MGEAIGAVLGYATAIAISPVPIAAVILMLMSGRARSNSLSFGLAWLVGITAATTVTLLLPGLETADRAPSAGAGWVKLVLGLFLLVAAVRQWRTRPSGDEEPAPPAWMGRIDELVPSRAFGLGFLLSAVNPKNLVLAIAAGVTMAGSGLTSGETVVVVAVFAVVAGSTVLAPVLASLVAGDRLTPSLDAIKDTLIRQNQAVMAVLFVVFGMSLLGDGIEILFS